MKNPLAGMFGESAALMDSFSDDAGDSSADSDCCGDVVDAQDGRNRRVMVINRIIAYPVNTLFIKIQ